MGLYLGRLISGGRGGAGGGGVFKKRQLTAGHHATVCSLPWTLNRKEAGINLVM